MATIQDEYLVKGSSLKGIADAIRSKTGTSGDLPFNDFASKISSISSSGSLLVDYGGVDWADFTHVSDGNYDVFVCEIDVLPKIFTISEPLPNVGDPFVTIIRTYFTTSDGSILSEDEVINWSDNTIRIPIVDNDSVSLSDPDVGIDTAGGFLSTPLEVLGYPHTFPIAIYNAPDGISLTKITSLYCIGVF